MDVGSDNLVPTKPDPETQQTSADSLKVEDSDTNPTSKGFKNSVVLDLGDTIYLKEHPRAKVIRKESENSLTTQPETFSKTHSLLLLHTTSNVHNTTGSITDELKLKNTSLGKTIRAALKRSVGRDGGKEFLPLGSLYRILTKERIFDELERHYPDTRRDELTKLVGDIWNTQSIPRSSGTLDQTTTRLRIFAILALFEKVKEIGNFIRDGLYDCHLPFTLSSTRDDGLRQLERHGENGGQSVELFSSWQVWELELYAEHMQWQVLSPYFQLSTSKHSTILHYNLSPKTILPFIEKDDFRRRGGFGEVFRVKIHPENHNCCQDPVSILMLVHSS
jgi:hypothetical protein